MVSTTEKLDPYYSCEGRNVVLYRFQPAFVDFIHFCYNQAEFIRNYRCHSKKSDRETLRDELKKVQSMPPGTLKSLEWVICKKNTAQPIGLAGLVNYQPQHQLAELLIGIPNSKDHPLEAVEATLLVIEFVFKTVKLNKLISLVYAYNQTAQLATLKLGFHQEGLLKKHIKKDDGQYVDLYHNALFSSDITTPDSKLSRLSRRCLGRDIADEIIKPAANIFDDDPVQALLRNR